MIAAAHPASTPRAANAWLAIMAIALTAMTIAAPTLHSRYSGWALIATFESGGLGAWAAERLAARSDQRPALIIILAGAVAMRLALLFVEPCLSSDIYRYIWDGRVQIAGINPYRYVPKAPELAQLRDAAIFPNINRASYAPTIYPPVALDACRSMVTGAARCCRGRLPPLDKSCRREEANHCRYLLLVAVALAGNACHLIDELRIEPLGARGTDQARENR
jgi:hypothetical protein